MIPEKMATAKAQLSQVMMIPNKTTQPKVLSRKTWDDCPDDPTHPDYNRVISELLPGHRLVSSRGSYKTDVARKLPNSRLQFARFWEYDLSTKVDARNVPARSRHFQQRLFSVLPWWSPDGNRVICILPVQALTLPPELDGFAEVVPMHSFVSLPTTCRGLSTMYFAEDVLVDKVPDRPEHVCRMLERCFMATGRVCKCCQAELPLRCLWCKQAKGWHQCQRHMHDSKIGFDSPLSYLWCPNSLYHFQSDVEVVITQMLDRAAHHEHILECIEDLKTSKLIDEDRYRRLIRFVQAAVGDLHDEGAITAPPNQLPVLSSNDAPNNIIDRSLLSERLSLLETKMQQLWDFDAKCYRLYSDFKPPRNVPSQYLAFDQLRLRFLQGEPIIAGIVAPAGFGKSELLSAWMHFLASRGCKHQVCGVTGIAGTQLGGCTVHNLLSLRADGSTDIQQHPERRRFVEELECIMIDEAFMAEEALITAFTDVLRQFPLRENKRRRGALKKFGYRDVIFGGDLRQLPPASGAMPYWASDYFFEDFELFVLSEDRRHERDLYTQSIKELVAWGGLQDVEDLSPDSPWPVHSRVRDFIVDGYVRGWGLTGSDVDLDVGTALFPKRCDVNRWNAACVEKIEHLHGKTCEAVDVIGYDPHASQASLQSTTRSTGRMNGLQSPERLTLRTCPEHRMRVLLLSNHNVGEGWANGTHCRLLGHSSWSGEPQKLKHQDVDKGCAKPVLPASASSNVQSEQRPKLQPVMPTSAPSDPFQLVRRPKLQPVLPRSSSSNIQMGQRPKKLQQKAKTPLADQVFPDGSASLFSCSFFLQTAFPSISAYSVSA